MIGEHGGSSEMSAMIGNTVSPACVLLLLLLTLYTITLFAHSSLQLGTTPIMVQTIGDIQDSIFAPEWVSAMHLPRRRSCEE